MKYRIRPAGIIRFISIDYSESLCLVESQCRWILFIYIHFCRAFLYRKFNEGRPITATAAFTVNKQHFNRVFTQPYETDEGTVVHDRIQVDMGEIIRYQCCFYLIYGSLV